MPAGRIFTARDMLHDPQYLAREMVQRHLSDAGLGGADDRRRAPLHAHAGRGPHAGQPLGHAHRDGARARWPGCTEDELDELTQGEG